MGLKEIVYDILFFGEHVNRCKNNQNSDSSSKKDNEYLHPSYRMNSEVEELDRIYVNQRNQHTIKISKMLEEIEKKESISRDKRGSIVALESFPEIIRDEIVKITGLPLNRLKEYSHGISDYDFSLPGDERIFYLTKLEEDHPKYRGSYVSSGWQGEYLENKEGKSFLRIWSYKH